MKLTAFSLEPIDLRLVRGLSTAAGTIGDRSGLLLRLESGDGDFVGIGEAAPVPGRPSDGLDSLAATVSAWARDNVGREIEDLAAGLGDAALAPPARFAVHTAVVDLQSRAAGMPLHQFLRVGANPQVAVSALVADDTPKAVSERCRELHQEGFGAVKLKVAALDTAADITRIVAASEALGPRIGLRLDANGGWTDEQFVHVIGRVGPRRVEFVEDPTAEPVDFGRLSERTGVAIALDAQIAEPDQLERAVTETGVGTLVVKAAVVGGVDRLVDLARRLGDDRRIVVSSSFDGPVGLRAALHAAAALPRDEIHGLGTGPMVRDMPDELSPVGGAIALTAEAGLGGS